MNTAQSHEHELKWKSKTSLKMQQKEKIARMCSFYFSLSLYSGASWWALRFLCRTTAARSADIYSSPQHAFRQ